MTSSEEELKHALEQIRVEVMRGVANLPPNLDHPWLDVLETAQQTIERLSSDLDEALQDAAEWKRLCEIAWTDLVAAQDHDNAHNFCSGCLANAEQTAAAINMLRADLAAAQKEIERLREENCDFDHPHPEHPHGRNIIGTPEGCL